MPPCKRKTGKNQHRMSYPYDFQCWLYYVSLFGLSNIQFTPGGFGAYCASMPFCLASWPVVLPCTWFFLEPQVYNRPIGRGKTL